jgi:hypothetical protein
MKPFYPSALIVLFFAILGCAEPKKPLPQVDPEFKSMLDTHGDWSKWINAKAMSYVLIHETNLTLENHFINLDSRETRIDASNFQIGYDGDSVWISPNREAFDGNSVKFYHNLYFYFLTIPYIFTDPEVTVEKVNDRILNRKTYKTFQAKMGNNTGSSPDDTYYMLVDPETNLLEYLLYTVTFFGNPDPVLSALKYEDYRSADGVQFPRVLTGYSLENDSTSTIRYQVSFGDVLLLDKKLDRNLFEKPENGVFTN